MADSLHDSLTDTHKPRGSSPSDRAHLISEPSRLEPHHGGELAALADGGQQGPGMSLHPGNWLGPAQPLHETQNPPPVLHQHPTHGMDVDESLPESLETAPLVHHHQPDRSTARHEKDDASEESLKRREGYAENAASTTDNIHSSPSLRQDASSKPCSGPQDSAIEDGHSIASAEAQSFSGAPMPHEGGPSITQSEAVAALEQAEQGVEVGGGFSDDGYETDSSATSQSLATSAREFIYQHGRRYHSYKADVNPYLFPNDDREQDREDLKHAMFLKLFNKTLHFAPVPAVGANVIDLGTGTGIWAVDFADLYPSANVLGIDLSPIQTVWVPPNLKFMVDDAEADWLHPPNSFDLIHTRHTIQAFRNWPQIFERALTHLKPGAWMECQELDHVPQCSDGTMADDNLMLTYWLQVTAGLKALGVDFRLAPHLATMMRNAGFINVTERVFFTPIGPWPKNRALKEVGMYWRATLMEGIEAIALGPMIRGLGWRKEEVEVFIAGVRKAYVDRETHAWMPFYIVYGQKPYAA